MGSHQHSRTAILDWLSSVTSDVPLYLNERPRKRIRIDPKPQAALLLPSPSLSIASWRYLMDPGGKRRRLNGLEDEELQSSRGGGHGRIIEPGDAPQPRDIPSTPRALQFYDNPPTLSPSTAPSQASTKSYASRNSSPTKQLRRLELDPDGFEHYKFAVSRNGLPASLIKLEGELRAIARGVGILPHNMRDQLSGIDIPEDAFSLQDERPRVQTSRYPPRDLIVWLLEQAVDCELNTHGECSWNMELHNPILEWAFRPDRRHRLVDYCYCTGAQVVRAFKAEQSPSNMVDFCIVIRPQRGSTEDLKIDSIRRRRPDVSINHTDHGILCRSPIAISVETKRPGGDLDQATLQMGTWHAAQWRSLSMNRYRASSILEFLPGLIVEGHKWSFVASTLKDGKSMLHSEVHLGSTSEEFGIVTILMALQHLARWVEETFWPAFKEEILGL